MRTPRTARKDQVGVGIAGGERAKKMKGALTYVVTDDLAATGKKIEEGGGRVDFGPQAVPDVGSFSVFLDPEGNQLALFKSARPQK